MTRGYYDAQRGTPLGLHAPVEPQSDSWNLPLHVAPPDLPCPALATPLHRRHRTHTRALHDGTIKHAAPPILPNPRPPTVSTEVRRGAGQGFAMPIAASSPHQLCALSPCTQHYRSCPAHAMPHPGPLIPAPAPISVITTNAQYHTSWPALLVCPPGPHPCPP